MADNQNMEDTNSEEEVVIFHTDPAINSILTTINDKASYYRLANGVLTGKFDKSYAKWRTEQTIDKDEVGELPDLSDVVEWMFINANLSELLSFKEVVDKLMTELNVAIFGHYAKKNVRGTVNHKVEDLKALRTDLINVLDGTLQLAASGIVPSALADGKLIEALESVGNRKPFGESSMVWDFPDAPSIDKTATDKAAAAAGTNLRKHNSNVKFVVDGKLPDEDTKLLLGDLCAKYFEKSTQEVGKMFGGWAKEYFIADDGTLPDKGVERNGVRYYLTYYSAK